MPQISPLIVRLLLIGTPPSDRVRDGDTLQQRVAHLENALAAIRRSRPFASHI